MTLAPQTLIALIERYYDDPEQAEAEAAVSAFLALDDARLRGLEALLGPEDAEPIRGLQWFEEPDRDRAHDIAHVFFSTEPSLNLRPKLFRPDWLAGAWRGPGGVWELDPAGEITVSGDERVPAGSRWYVMVRGTPLLCTRAASAKETRWVVRQRGDDVEILDPDRLGESVLLQRA